MLTRLKNKPSHGTACNRRRHQAAFAVVCLALMTAFFRFR